MSDIFSSTSSNFDEAPKPKSGSVDPELDNFLMIEKQKAQFTAQVSDFAWFNQGTII